MNMKTLSLGYSPCPNDTFIFDALVNGKIDSGALSFNEILLDVETLNRKALNAELDVTKISYAAYGLLRENYVLLRSGGALGRGCGPLVVAKHEYTLEQLHNKKIAIPGKLTTAFLLLRLCDPFFGAPVSEGTSPGSVVIEMPFNSIMGTVAHDEADAGLIIHESRFTYPSYGLKQVIDLGNWWEKETGLPIPLGGIAARRTLGAGLIGQIDMLIKQSVEYAFSNRTGTMGYVKRHAQELSDDVINQHINLYVNNFSIGLGKDGENAVREFMIREEKAHIIPESQLPIFN